MIAIILLLTVPILMWLSQTVALKSAGLPLRWRIDAGDAPSVVRTSGRVVTQLSLVAIIVAFPFLKGKDPITYYRLLLPPSGFLQALQGIAASCLFLCALFGAWLASERLYVSLHQSKRKRRRRLAMLLPTAILGALVEELIFRAILFEDLLRSAMPVWTAFAVGIILFAGAHYVRTPKRFWTFPGHLALGGLLCTSFFLTRTLWLPIGLHAGGILMIMGSRPLMRYRGPAWVTGASVFPYGGVIGIGGLALLTAFVVHHYG